MRLPQKKVLKIILALFLAVAGLLFVQSVFAQFGINEVGNEIALPATEDPRIVAARIIRVALGFLGIIALAIVLYGGFVWMTSAGNEERITKAKKILTNGLIGLIIIVSAFGITQFVLNRLSEAIGRAGIGAPTGPPVIGRYSGALGNSIIDSHYPPRGGTGIPRNTKIIVTFKEPMSLKSIIEGYDEGVVTQDTVFSLKSENIRIYRSKDGETGKDTADKEVLNYLQPTQVRVTYTDDKKTFVFDPIDYLGSPSENIWYSVAIKPGVKKADGKDAFTGAFRDGYAWDFEVSTFIDTTPPKVESVWPWPRGVTLARNTLVQVNFNEAMDPTTVTGKWTNDTTDTFDFNNIVVMGGGTQVNGTWEIGNQYKTIEFTTDFQCGTNSCGGDVFCLPENALITVTVKAASLSAATPPEADWPYNGATDVVGNSLDGDKDGTAEGPSADNYGWGFNTNDEIDLVPPRIEEVTPGPPGSSGASNVPLTAPIEMQFSKIMSMISFNTDNIILADNQLDECAIWFTNGGANLKSDNTPVTLPTDDAAKTKAIINHGDFIESVTTATPLLPAPYCGKNAADEDVFALNPASVSGYVSHIMYYPRATHNVKDIYQNCFFEPVGPEDGGKCIVNPSTNAPPDNCEPWE